MTNNDAANEGASKTPSIADGAKTKRKVAKPMTDKYSLIPEDFKYENKHYKYIKYTKNDPENTYKVSCA